MTIDEAILHAIDGNAILFLGSGFSFGAKNFNNESFPLGDDTCERLIKYGNIDVSSDNKDDIKDLSYISERFLETNNKVDLLKYLSLQFKCKRTEEYHKEIAKINWKRIYTTNYDNLFEKASEEVTVYRETLTPEKRSSDVLKYKNTIIHMNGYIGNVNESNLMTTFKLLGNSYLYRTIPDSEWAISLHNDLKTARAIIFVGYSMDYDLELQQIFASVDEVKNKSVFVTFNPSRRQRHNMQKFGDLFEEGVSKFASKIKEATVRYDGTKKKYSLFCLKEIDAGKIVPSVSVSDKDVLDLFFDGDIKMDHIFSSKTKEYVVKREVVDEIVKSFEDGSRSIIIHSDLGNGKSVIVREVEEKLCHLGHVYYLDNISPSLRDDLDYISELKGNKYIVVENYNRIIDSPYSKVLSLYQRSDIRYVFTVRTYLNENLFLRFLKAFNVIKEYTVIFDVNRLTSNDQLELYRLLETYKFWGPHSTLKSKDKKRFIRSSCQGEIKNVLLDLLKSKELGRKIDSILNTLFSNDDIKEITLFAFVCNIIASELSLSDIVIILNKQARIATYLEDSSVREFFDFKHNKIVLKSPVVAKYILQNRYYNEDIEKLIIRILPVLDNHSEEYENLLRMIISISNLRIVFNVKEENIQDRFIRIYERAKLLKYHKENPFFWLQYSMACMDSNEYERAEVYLENAEAYARSRNFDSWQIKIQKARYYLMSTIHKKDLKNAFANFCLAHKLIIDSTTTSMYYPLRQLTAYSDFYKLFYSTLEEPEKAVFLFDCYEAYNTIEKLLKSKDKSIMNDNSRERELTRIKNSLNTVVNKIQRGIK